MNSDGCKLKKPKSIHLFDPFISLPIISTIKTTNRLIQKRAQPTEIIRFKFICQVFLLFLGRVYVEQTSMQSK